MAERAKSLDDEQTKLEFKIANATGDPNRLVSAGLGVTIRAAVGSVGHITTEDRNNLQIIDENINKIDPELQVGFRNQMLFDIYKCNGNTECVQKLLKNLANSTSAATKNNKNPSVS